MYQEKLNDLKDVVMNIYSIFDEIHLAKTEYNHLLLK